MGSRLGSYALKLLELEVRAEDKLENQESDFRAFFEEEKAPRGSIPPEARAGVTGSERHYQ